MKNLLESILVSPGRVEDVASKSYEHVNGFDKLVLSASPKHKLRLHIWWPISEELAQRKEGFRVHNHRWDFSSVILNGRFRSQKFQVSGDEHGYFMNEYKYFSPEEREYFKMEMVGTTCLTIVFDGVMHAGDYYSLSHVVPHRVTSDRSQLTATLILQGPIAKTWTNVYADKVIENAGKVSARRLAAKDIVAKLESFLIAF